MTRLVLTHVTFTGSQVEDAVVEFSTGATLIRGPSDTGKSFIVEAVDFMLGANSLKEIPEREGYTTALLGLSLPDGTDITLTRPVGGGSIGLYNGDVRGQPLGSPDRIVAAKHNPSSLNNLSRYVLAYIGLDGKRIRKNIRNETDSLSFRNLGHLCIVNETQMQSEVPPALTGQYVTRTKEISTLKLLLQDEDDSSLTPMGRDAESARLSGARNEVIDRMIADIEAQLSETPEANELRGQLERLNQTIAQQGASIERLSSARDQISVTQSASKREETVVRSRLGEATALIARFKLLLDQYNSDLSRLEMLNEAGSLLGYFRPGTCVFCGAEPEYQHLSDPCDGDTTYFRQSIEAEQQKTTFLRDDLVVTLRDLDAELAQLRAQLVEVRDRLGDLGNRLLSADRSLRPHRENLSELLSARSSVEGKLGLYGQISKLEEFRASLAEDSKVDSSSAASAISLHALREFSQSISDRLAEWGFPDPDKVRYDRTEQDVVAGDQLRSAHGKGVRAILHAAFTVALAQYCFDRDIPHPGFVILDSPLVTYRPPGDPTEGEALSASEYTGVIDSFYQDIQRNFDGQIIIMENVDPINPLLSDSADVVFTKNATVGRYGFFPKSIRVQLG